MNGTTKNVLRIESGDRFCVVEFDDVAAGEPGFVERATEVGGLAAIRMQRMIVMERNKQSEQRLEGLLREPDPEPA